MPFMKASSESRKMRECQTQVLPLASCARQKERPGPVSLYQYNELLHRLGRSDRLSLRASFLGVAGNKVGRNDPCPCGSEKKYKRRCWGGHNRHAAILGDGGSTKGTATPEADVSTGGSGAQSVEVSALVSAGAPSPRRWMLPR